MIRHASWVTSLINMFVGHVLIKLKKDVQYQSKELQYLTTYLEHLQFISLELKANNFSRECQFSYIFYDRLKLLREI